MTLAAEPLWRMAAWNPAASASAPMKIVTVSPTPIAVVSVATGRCRTLRMLYERGIAIACSLFDAPQRFHDAETRRLPCRDQTAHRSHQERDPDAGGHGGPVHAHRRQEAADVEPRAFDRKLAPD